MLINLTNLTKIKIFLVFFIKFFLLQNVKFHKYLIKNFKISFSQVFQDLFVLYFSENKKRGIFIEIGGGDGKIISNSYLLEKKYKWTGIICEPNIFLQNKIKINRKCKLEKKPLYYKCKEKITFFLNEDPYQSSTKKINKSKKIILNAICLNHLFYKYKLSLKKIDYISIDTEGTEFEILKNFNFKKFNVKIFSIEHNFDKAKRNKIFKLMSKNGYKRVYKFFSYMDDWYIKYNRNEKFI
tara:strand:+ start:397 stop:1116 length:720 start_codon:yes stop_codon:yes gene_type:complete